MPLIFSLRFDFADYFIFASIAAMLIFHDAAFAFRFRFADAFAICCHFLPLFRFRYF